MNPIHRFWELVDTGLSTACWNWKGRTINTGYGRLRFNRKRMLAHRVAWELASKESPGDSCILHHCDNRLCCNPSHLFAGTRQDNMTDMVSKGRQNRGDRHWSILHPELRPRGDRHGMRLHPESVPRGERSGTAKLTDAVVAEIRRRFAAGESCRAMGVEYGVNRNHILKVAKGLKWRHTWTE